MATFVVITAIPDPSKPRDEQAFETTPNGNMANSIDLWVESPDADGFAGDDEPMHRTPATLALTLMSPVFELGEILVVDDEWDREIGGAGRKPSKWFIEFEEFKDVDEAIKRSREVTDRAE